LTYTRDAQVVPSGHVIECLTDSELETAIAVLDRELNRRERGAGNFEIRI
jgi:hypothetical protein